MTIHDHPRARGAGRMLSWAVLGLSLVHAPAAWASEDEVPDSWQLVWADEFEGTGIDPDRWTLVEDCWGGGNEERQCYTSRERNAAIEGGLLVITAHDEQYTGFAVPERMRSTASDPGARATLPFTSAKLTTQGRASWRYGRVEVRARLPRGQGVWPAIWMLPEDNRYGGWAASGEIDILEAVNLGVECDTCEPGGENTILGTLHFGGQWPDNTLHSTEISYPPVLDDGFHVFGLVWEQGRIAWTIDGSPYAEAVAGDWHTTASDDPAAPFDQPFHLILNLAIGGGLAEGRGQGGVSNEGFPKRMEVDWVRVWQCEADPASGLGCSGGQ